LNYLFEACLVALALLSKVARSAANQAEWAKERLSALSVGDN